MLSRMHALLEDKKLPMSAIRLKHPGAPEMSVIALKAKRVTIGRARENTIRIFDRTVSVHHAELIDIGGQYRLRDLGSTNRTLVDGKLVTEIDLRERCKLTFGAFECEFLPELAADATEPDQALQIPAEANTVLIENVELKTQIAKLRQEIEALNQAKTSLETAGASYVPREQYESLRMELKDACSAREKELAQAGVEIDALQEERDRYRQSVDTLNSDQAALSSEIESLRTENMELKTRVEREAAELDEILRTTREGADELAALYAEREETLAEYNALRKAFDRRESETQVRTDELESLRSENVGLEKRIETLLAMVESLRETGAAREEQLASSVAREEHERVVAENTALEEVRQRREMDFAELNQKLQDLLTQRGLLEDELKALKERVEHPSGEDLSLAVATPEDAWISDQVVSQEPEEEPEENLTEDQPVPAGNIEDVFRDLGFVIRPVGRKPGGSTKEREDSSDTATSKNETPHRSGGE